MYYTYLVVDADGDDYRGLVCADTFTGAMAKVDDYYVDVNAVSTLLTCVTDAECYDVDEMDTDDIEEYEDAHEDTCDGNFTLKAETTVTPHIDIDMDEIEKLMEILKQFED